MKKNMEYNFNKLVSRVYYSLNNTDLERINYILKNINEPTLTSGVGGSSVVSNFASHILNKKNGIITQSMEPRDFKHTDMSRFKNVISCSYSGNNYGVELSFMNNLKHFLLSSKEVSDNTVTNLTYKIDEAEKSFISLSSTLIPCSILLNYYLSYYEYSKDHIIDEYIEEHTYNFNASYDIYEIFSGIDTSTASKYLESTFVESGIAIPIIHDKYSYCHGRSTLSTRYNSAIIYFNTDTELDKLLLEELKKYHKEIIIVNIPSSIIGDYIGLVKSMYLTKYIAEKKKLDLSGVDYSPIVKKLYKYNGEI